MTYKIMKRPLFLLFVLLVSIPLIAGTNDTVSYRKTLNITNGLSHNGITCIHQDSKKYIWIGTYDGLNLYDGNKIEIYKNSRNKRILPSNRITSIEEDCNERIWIATDTGLAIYDYQKDHFKIMEGSLQNNLQQLIFNEKARLMYAIYTNGIVKIYNQNLILAKTEKLQGTNINAAVSDGERIYLATNKGIISYDLTKNTFRSLWWDSPASSIVTTQSGNILFHAKNKIFKLKPDALNTCDIVLALDEPIKYIHSDNDKGLWISTVKNGFIHYPNLDDVNISKEYLMSERASCVLSDFDKSWLCTYDNGAFLIQDNTIKVNSITSLINPERITLPRLLQIKGNSVNIRCNSGKNYIYDANLKNIRELLSIPKGSYLVKTSDEELINLIGGQLYHTDSKFKIQKQFHLSSKIPEKAPVSSTCDPYGNIWLGYENELYRINIDLKSHSAHVDNITSNQAFDQHGPGKIRTLYYDNKSDALFIGTNHQGLYVINHLENREHDSIISNIRHDDNDTTGLSSNFVSSILRAKDGTLWIGTEQGGLCKINSTEQEPYCQVYTEYEGLSNDVIKSIIDDPYGNLWVGTNIGLNCINKKNNRIINYFHEDGLPAEGFWYDAICTDNGTILCTSTEDVYAFNTEDVITDDTLPVIHLRSINLFNEKILPDKIYNGRVIIDQKLKNGDTIKLKYNENSFSIDFDAIYSRDAQSHEIAYRLCPISDQWTQLPYDGKPLHFNGVRDGNYTIEIKACNIAGKWTNPIKLHLIIQPPFYKSGIAYGIYLVCITLLFLLIIKIITHIQNLKHEIEVKTLERRHAIVRSAEKQKFFSNISHEMKTPISLISVPLAELTEKYSENLDVREKLDMIRRQLKKITELIDLTHGLYKYDCEKLVLVPRYICLNEILKEFCKDYQLMAKYENKNFNCEFPDKIIMVNVDREALMTILNNIISNAFTYTSANDNINISITYNHHLLYVNVTDTGEGIDKKDLEHLFDLFYVGNSTNLHSTGIGLAFSKQLAEMMHGNIEVSSTKGEGSCFLIKLDIIASVENNDTSHNTLRSQIQTKDTLTNKIHSEYKEADIYIVDDNKEFREMLIELLSKEYKTVSGFPNVDKCMEAINDQCPDLIITDINMPGTNGLEFCATLKGDLNTCHIPIILLTGRNNIEDEIAGYKSGADAYIEKPFYPEDIIVRIDNLFRNKNLLQESFKNGLPISFRKCNGLSQKDAEFLRELYDLFKKNLDNEDIDMEAFITSLGMNRSQFFKKIKAITNTSPYELLKEFRLEQAAIFFQDTDMNVNEVCNMTGFKSRTHFSRLFKEKFGVAPSQYLNRVRKK